MEHGVGFSVIENGRKRQAFPEELTQPQQEFLFHAKEQRKAMRQEDANVGNEHSETHHIT